MNLNRGEIIENAVRKSNMKINVVADRLNIARKTLYNWFKWGNVDLETIQRIGKIIHHDFTDDIPELRKLKNLNVLEESQAEYITKQEVKSIITEQLSALAKDKDEEIRMLKEIIRNRENQIHDLELQIRKLHMDQKKIKKEYTY